MSKRRRPAFYAAQKLRRKARRAMGSAVIRFSITGPDGKTVHFGPGVVRFARGVR